jgi:hypothetical protein
MSTYEPSHAAAGIPLKAHVEELRSRCEAASRLQGGSTYYHEELGIFRCYAAENDLFLSGPPAELSRPPDDEGNEQREKAGRKPPINGRDEWHAVRADFVDPGSGTRSVDILSTVSGRHSVGRRLGGGQDVRGKQRSE